MGTESDPKLRLYLRLPVRIDEELQIKELHPDINKVVLPRQKSRRWCVVQFPSVEILQKARKEIKRKKINGRKIIVSSYKQGKKKPKQKKTKANEEAFWNPHKTEYEDIDEDFNILAEELVDNQDYSDYEDEDDDYYEDEEDDDNDDEDDDDDDDGEGFWDMGFLSDSDSTIDIDIPGPPDGGRVDIEEVQKEEPTVPTEKEAAEPKILDDVVHRNLESNSETINGVECAGNPIKLS
ncbi:hypothetical protein Trydic_g9267 [Trypoxylus dichotomus]